LVQRVNYDDLDIATAAGADELHRRIQDVARSVCQQLILAAPPPSSPIAVPSNVMLNREGQTCIRDAVSAAMPGAHKAIAAAESQSRLR
jgi:UrcA family protein